MGVYLRKYDFFRWSCIGHPACGSRTSPAPPVEKIIFS